MCEFIADPRFSPSELVQLVQALGTHRVDSRHRTSVTFLDTFDGLLQQSRLELSLRPRTGGITLSLQTDRAEPITLRMNDSTVPRFATDLPPSLLQRRLSRCTGVRALLPVVKLNLDSTTLALLDDEKKTIARIRLENITLPRPKGQTLRLAPRVTVEPLRGYGKTARQLRRRLQEHPHLAEAQSGIYQTALAHLEIAPSENSSKLRLALHPDMRADEATRTILLTLLQTMKLNEPGLREAIDSEFLHDFRVSVRRTRSALNQIKGVLPRPVLARFSKAFSWLGTITTPLRDLDVYLLHYPDYEAELPTALRPDLAPLHTFLVSHQDTAHKRLLRHLNSRRYAKLCADWQKYLTSPLPKTSTLANATRPIGDVANERIWKVYRRTMKQGRAIREDSAAEKLHELRKTCKKLRYLMEFFRSLYPGKAIARAIKTLKQLQEVLGTYQDLDVQQQTLRHFAEQMNAEEATPEATLRAMEWLVERLRTRQEATRTLFTDRFEAFSAKPQRQLFHSLFCTPPDRPAPQDP